MTIMKNKWGESDLWAKGQGGIMLYNFDFAPWYLQATGNYRMTYGDIFAVPTYIADGI